MITHYPETPTFSKAEQQSLCRHYLRLLYQDVNLLPAKSHNQIPLTYGEILYPGVNKIISCLSLTEHDVFMDLGSGIGKVVAQVFLLTNVKAAYGIEILSSLHALAANAADKIYHECPDFFSGGRELNFIRGDFLEMSLEKATVLLFASPCFSPAMMAKLEQMLARLPRVHSMITLQPMLECRSFRLNKIIQIECSWDSAQCYLYQRC